MRRHCFPFLFLALLAAAPALGIDVTRPAQVRLVVTDDQGQPLPGARVRWFGPEPIWPEEPKPAVEFTTDDTGSLQVERLRPDDAAGIPWSETFRVDLDGYRFTGSDWTVALFPGAKLEQTVSLDREQTTLVRLRGPDGEPLPRIRLRASYGRGGYEQTEFLFTDDKGEAPWRHGSLKEGFSITVHRAAGSDAPQGELHRDGAVVTITYERDSLPFPARRLEGKLLQADGSAAEGWLVARWVSYLGGGGAIRGPVYDDLRVEHLRRVGADGRFEADAEELLAVISPAGIPLLYALNPQSWEPATRHITLRLPDIRRMHHGVVVDEAGEPVAGLPIELYSVRWNGANWMFPPEADSADWQVRSWRAIDGWEIEPIRTDAEGRYSIPVYAGSTANFDTFREGWWLKDAEGFETTERAVWMRLRQRTDPVDPEEFKQLTLVFEDEQAKRLPSVTLDWVKGYAEGELVYNHGGGLRDSHGLYLFLRRSADRLEVKTNDPERKWSPLETTLDIAGPDDRVIRVTMDEALRLQPLAGSVLDPDGHPVPNARVSLLKPADEVRDRHNIYVGMNTETDEQGRFSFEAAPDNCRIDIRLDRSATDAGLPGWMTPLVVDRRSRDATIRLQRGGTVKVLLPEGIGDAAKGMFLKREGMPDDTPVRLRNEYFRHDVDRNELLSGFIRPGSYLLGDWSSELTEWFGALGTLRPEVEPGQEVVVDLRRHKFAERRLPVERPGLWNTVVIEHEGEVVSGAEVTVYAATARPEELTRWMQQWKSGDAAARKAALAMLDKAGALAVDAINAAEDDAFGVDQLIADLAELGIHDPYGRRSDGLDRLDRDLTGDTGSVRCEIEEGRHCVAVARVRGRLVGWTSFVAEGERVTVDLRPARTLLVRSEEAAAEPDEPSDDWLHVRLEQSASPGTRALLSALTHAHGRSSFAGLTTAAVLDRQYAMQADGRASWILEDLPLGTEWTVTRRDTYLDQFRDPLKEKDDTPPELGRVTIEAGEGMQVVEW